MGEADDLKIAVKSTKKLCIVCSFLLLGSFDLMFLHIRVESSFWVL